MRRQDGTLSQEKLDEINENLTRAIAENKIPKFEPIFMVDRVLFWDAQILQRAPRSIQVLARGVGGEIHQVAHGRLISSRRVDPFNVYLVHEKTDEPCWAIIIEKTTTGQRSDARQVGVLRYGSGARTAEEVAAKYFITAAAQDLASDLHPNAHHFGERRIPKSQ